MKTCSFRGAQPLSAMEGLFCNENEPEARYQLNPCGQVDCCLCCNPNIIDFTSTSMHQFINGYTTYLNCPAVYYFSKDFSILFFFIEILEMYDVKCYICFNMSMW